MIRWSKIVLCVLSVVGIPTLPGEGGKEGAVGRVTSDAAATPGSTGRGEASSPPWRKDVVAAILEGAREEVRRGTVYFIENRYLKTTYLDGVDQKKKVYPWGDIPPGIGVCTDLVIRALRAAGFDLQKRVHEDMRKDLKKFKIYPWGKWKKRFLDTNIDHRRCPNLEVFFKRHSDVYEVKEGAEIDLEEFQPGDIVYWDLQTGRYHIGIVSDKRNEAGVPLVIHNYPIPGYTTEEDMLFGFKLLYRFRYPPDSEDPPERDAK